MIFKSPYLLVAQQHRGTEKTIELSKNNDDRAEDESDRSL